MEVNAHSHTADPDSNNQMIQLKEKTNRVVAYLNAKYHLD